MKNSILILMLALLTGCGDGSSSKTGTFNLAVSDDPSDAQIVNIAFKQVVLKGESESYSFTVSEPDGDEDPDNNPPKHVDLVTFSCFKTADLVSDAAIAVGEYQLCIYMENVYSVVYSDDDPATPTSSYVKDPDGNIVGLSTPSEGACGDGVGADEENTADTGRLFINKKFTISEGENSYIAEFELNKVLKEPTGQDTFWTLKPTGIELIEAGSIAGEVSGELANACVAPSLPVVYLYRETEVTSVASATAVMNDQENYVYEFPAVYAGSYSLGYSCTAEEELADEADISIMDAVQQNVEVVVGTTTAVNFE